MPIEGFNSAHQDESDHDYFCYFYEECTPEVTARPRVGLRIARRRVVAYRTIYAIYIVYGPLCMLMMYLPLKLYTQFSASCHVVRVSEHRQAVTIVHYLDRQTKVIQHYI